MLYSANGKRELCISLLDVGITYAVKILRYVEMQITISLTAGMKNDFAFRKPYHLLRWNYAEHFGARLAMLLISKNDISIRVLQPVGSLLGNAPWGKVCSLPERSDYSKTVLTGCL